MRNPWKTQAGNKRSLGVSVSLVTLTKTCSAVALVVLGAAVVANWTDAFATVGGYGIEPLFLPVGCTPAPAIAPGTADTPATVSSQSVPPAASDPAPAASTVPDSGSDAQACPPAFTMGDFGFSYGGNESFILRGAQFKAISMGGGHSCAIMADDKVICWGSNENGEAPLGVSADSFKAIAANTRGDELDPDAPGHTCGIRSDDKVVCWGSNHKGQAPPGPSAGSFKAIAAGTAHTCGIRSDDKVVCWGDNEKGQAPTRPSTHSFKSISAGYVRTCGVNTDNKLVCWGDNSGDTHPFDSLDPPAGPSKESYKSITMGQNFACGIKQNNRIDCLESDEEQDDPSMSLDPLGTGRPQHPTVPWKAIALSKTGVCGLLGNASLDCRTLLSGPGYQPPTPIEGSFKAIAATNSSELCGIRTDGRIVCWGDKVLKPLDRSFKAVFEDHSGGTACAIQTDNKLFCWGVDWHGMATPPRASFKNIAFGFDFACGIQTNGKIGCWGMGGSFDLPGGNAGSFQAIVVGSYRTYGIQKNGRVVSWFLRDNGWEAAETPREAVGDTFTAIANNGLEPPRNLTCGLKTNGKVVCWGMHDRTINLPTDSFKEITIYESISYEEACEAEYRRNSYHTCGIRTDDKVICWSDTQRSNPTTDSFKAISMSGENRVCGIRADNKVFCWGGAYGNDPVGPSKDSFKAISASYGIRTDGAIVLRKDYFSN